MQLYPSDKSLGYFQSSALRTLLFDTQLYPSDKSLGFFQLSAARTCFAGSFPTLFEVPSPSQEFVPAGFGPGNARAPAPHAGCPCGNNVSTKTSARHAMCCPFFLRRRGQSRSSTKVNQEVNPWNGRLRVENRGGKSAVRFADCGLVFVRDPTAQ